VEKTELISGVPDKYYGPRTLVYCLAAEPIDRTEPFAITWQLKASPDDSTRPHAAVLKVTSNLSENAVSPSECPACGCPTARLSHIGATRFESFEYRYLECLACGSLYADPMPGPELLSHIYSPTYTATHYAAELEGESSSEDLVRESREVISLLSGRKPAGRLLDIGCGGGQFLLSAQERGFRVEGHELIPASAAVIERATGVPVHSGALSALSGGYEIVHMADVLEHSPRPTEMLRDAVSLLAPRGVILLRGPLENQINLFQQAMRVRRQITARLEVHPPIEMPPYHVNLFTLAGWRSLTNRADLVQAYEHVYEIHWPAPERFTPTAIWLVKTASLALTSTALGRRLALGNRVVTLLGGGPDRPGSSGASA
jgi:SAM-dependent methyltransferase